MVSIRRRPSTIKEFDIIMRDYWEKVIPMYRVKPTTGNEDTIQFDTTAWANSGLEIFRYEHKTFPKSNRGLLLDKEVTSRINLILEPNRWVVLFRNGRADKDRNEIFIFYVLDIESRKGGYDTIWGHPPAWIRSANNSYQVGKIFSDWGPTGWAANDESEWAYLDVAKDTGGFINWPFENPLHRGGSV
mgnify:FL=1